MNLGFQNRDRQTVTALLCYKLTCSLRNWNIYKNEPPKQSFHVATKYIYDVFNDAVTIWDWSQFWCPCFTSIQLQTYNPNKFIKLRVLGKLAVKKISVLSDLDFIRRLFFFKVITNLKTFKKNHYVSNEGPSFVFG